VPFGRDRLRLAILGAIWVAPPLVPMAHHPCTEFGSLPDIFGWNHLICGICAKIGEHCLLQGAPLAFCHVERQLCATFS
jgi:hypothetical protein